MGFSLSLDFTGNIHNETELPSLKAVNQRRNSAFLLLSLIRIDKINQEGGLVISGPFWIYSSSRWTCSDVNTSVAVWAFHFFLHFRGSWASFAVFHNHPRCTLGQHRVPEFLPVQTKPPDTVCDVAYTGAAGTSQSRVMLPEYHTSNQQVFWIPSRKLKIIFMTVMTSFQKVVQQHTSHDYGTQSTVLYALNSPLFCGVKDQIFVVNLNKFVLWVDPNKMDATRLRKQKH